MVESSQSEADGEEDDSSMDEAGDEAPTAGPRGDTTTVASNGGRAGSAETTVETTAEATVTAIGPVIQSSLMDTSPSTDSQDPDSSGSATTEVVESGVGGGGGSSRGSSGSMNGQYAEATAWLRTRLSGHHTGNFRAIVKTAMELGNSDTIEALQRVYTQLRDRPGVESLAVPVPNHFNPDKCRHQLALWNAVCADRMIEARSTVHDVARRATLVQMYDAHSVLFDKVYGLALLQGAVGVDARSRALWLAFWTAAPQYYGILKPHTNPATKAAYKKFTRRISFGKRWSYAKDVLGFGILALIPPTIDDFLQARLKEAEFKAWVELVHRFHLTAVTLGGRIHTTLGRYMESGQPLAMIPSQAPRIILEHTNLDNTNWKAHNAVLDLFSMRDSGMTSGGESADEPSTVRAGEPSMVGADENTLLFFDQAPQLQVPSMVGWESTGDETNAGYDRALDEFIRASANDAPVQPGF